MNVKTVRMTLVKKVDTSFGHETIAARQPLIL